MQVSAKALVVGTTSDYIDWIRTSCPERALFLTSPAVRRKAQEPSPAPAEEILCDLSDYEGASRALRQHLHAEGMRVDGVASYDCESMELAAVLAREFELPYPSIQAVNNCRNKHLSKTLWESHQLHTPRVRQIRSAAAAVQFFRDQQGPCVLKPLSGSGSELIFRCDSERACEQRFVDIVDGLQQRRSERLYSSFSADEPVMLAEALINGDEYSCDFMIENGRVEIIRLTRKIPSSAGPFGTTLGYLLPGALPPEIDEAELRHILYRSAAALGLTRAICMLDFMIDQGEIILLELAPRPGGDCIPFLLRRCRQLDILKLFLDFSQKRPWRIDAAPVARSFIGLRLHAGKGGVLKGIDAGQLRRDSRVLEVHLTRNAGHLIKMPPDDYDSWLLGHVIFEPDAAVDPQPQCRDLLQKLFVEIE